MSSVDDDLRAIASCATAAGVRVAVAESLTSGAIAARLGTGPDTGAWFVGGVVAYSERVKFDVLGVEPGPVVTAACARQLGEGVSALLDAEVVVAVTGVGGPGEEEGRPAWTVFLAHGRRGALEVAELRLPGDPADVVRETVEAAVGALADDLRGLAGRSG